MEAQGSQIIQGESFSNSNASPVAAGDVTPNLLNTAQETAAPTLQQPVLHQRGALAFVELEADLAQHEARNLQAEELRTGAESLLALHQGGGNNIQTGTEKATGGGEVASASVDGEVVAELPLHYPYPPSANSTQQPPHDGPVAVAASPSVGRVLSYKRRDVEGGRQGPQPLGPIESQRNIRLRTTDGGHQDNVYNLFPPPPPLSTRELSEGPLSSNQFPRMVMPPQRRPNAVLPPALHAQPLAWYRSGDTGVQPCTSTLPGAGASTSTTNPMNDGYNATFPAGNNSNIAHQTAVNWVPGGMAFPEIQTIGASSSSSIQAGGASSACIYSFPVPPLSQSQQGTSSAGTDSIVVVVVRPTDVGAGTEGGENVEVPRNVGSSSSAAPAGSRTLDVSEVHNATVPVRVDGAMTFEEMMTIGRSLANGLPLEPRDRYEDMRLDIEVMTYEELLQLEEEIGEVGIGLTEEAIEERMNRTIYASNGGEPSDELCPICREDYANGDNLGKLDCGHYFHFDCIRQWLLIKNKCPICKKVALGLAYN